MSNGQTQKAYEVLRVDEMTRVAELGGIEHYYRHIVKAKGGSVFTVDIDDKTYWDEKAGPILLKKAQIADRALSL